MALRLYPIGIQTFERIRKEDKLYIDKTEYIYRMAHTSGKFFFLGRSRRFALSGKPITKVGINFDPAQGNITDWVVRAEEGE